MNRTRRLALVLALLVVTCSGVFALSVGIVAGTRVRLRAGPSLSDAIVRELPLGTIADILDATTGRERIDTTREFSYCWYEIELPDGARGWIYGQYFYPFRYEGREAVAIGGEWYQLAVFQEDGYLNDMPSQDQYALPCLVRERDGKAVVFGIDPSYYRMLPSYQETSGREIVLPGTTYLLVSNTGMSEQVVSAESGQVEGAEVLMLKISFSLQTGGGSYTLVLAPRTRAGDPFVVLDVKDAVIQSGL
jgi:hypothetical protein